MWLWLAGYLVLGASAGLLAGLLGVGGGAVMVPVLTMMFAAQGFAEQHILHLALGTSLATIIFTSMVSARAHHLRGAVLWPVVRAIAPGIVFGTLLGAQCASRLPVRFLAIFFTLFIITVAVQMLLNAKPQASRRLPGRWGMFGVGGGIGVISALVAIGGGSLSVPFMTWCNIKIHHAIGTSAAIGFPIAVAGTVGYMIAGTSAPGLPSGAMGYIYGPALIILVITSMLMAPLGVRLAHSLPIAAIKKIFAAVLVGLAMKMIYTLF